MKTLYLSTTLFMLFLSLLFSALPVSAQEAITLDKRSYLALSPQASACMMP